MRRNLPVDKILYASLAAAVILLIAAIVLMVKNRCTDPGLVCVRETWMTAVMGVMLMAMGVFITVMKLTDPSVAGTDKSSYWFVAVFGLLCHLLGVFMLLYTFVKRIVLFEDRIEDCSPFGITRTMYWGDIVQVEKPVTRKAYILTDRDGNTISVSGDSKASKAFVDFARTKIKSAQGTNLLHHVERRLKGRL